MADAPSVGAGWSHSHRIANEGSDEAPAFVVGIGRRIGAGLVRPEQALRDDRPDTKDE
jgi:hypothetical protein